MHQSIPAALMPSFPWLTPGYTRFCLSFLLLPPTPLLFFWGGGGLGHLSCQMPLSLGRKKRASAPPSIKVEEKGMGGAVSKKIFSPFGPHFGLKIREGAPPLPRSPTPGSATVLCRKIVHNYPLKGR